MYRPCPEHDRDQECGFSYSHEPTVGSDRPLPVTELALRMDGLTKADDDSEARARSAEATVFLSYADLSDALGLELTRGYGSDRIHARVLTALRFEVTATTTVSAASGNRGTFKDFKVAGRVARHEASETLLGQVFAEPIAPRNIPDGLRLRSVTTTEQGLTAHFSGKSVTFRRDDARDTSSNGSAGEKSGAVGRKGRSHRRRNLLDHRARPILRHAGRDEGGRGDPVPVVLQRAGVDGLHQS
jgi:hypothetical protein